MDSSTGERPLVYVPNKSGHDFSGALEYGDLVYITEGTVNRYDVNSVYRRCAEAMRDARPSDYLLITSLNIINSIAAAILARRFGKVRFLLFKGGSYILREVDIDQLL